MATYHHYPKFGSQQCFIVWDRVSFESDLHVISEIAGFVINRVNEAERGTHKILNNFEPIVDSGTSHTNVSLFKFVLFSTYTGWRSEK